MPADGIADAKKRPIGRPRINGEQMVARFPEGTMAQIDAHLDDGENRSDFVRTAVSRELDRRGGD